VEEEARNRQANTGKPDEHAAEPKGAALSEKRDRADDQTDFEERFSAVKTIGAPADKVALFFEFSCLLADVLFISIIAPNFFCVFFAQHFGLFFVLRGEGAEQVGDHRQTKRYDTLWVISQTSVKNGDLRPAVT